MSQNLLKRISTSIVLLSILIFVTFINEYIFITSIYIVGGIICLESNNMFLRLVNSKSLKNKMLKRFDFKFLILNLTTFLYVFFIFCALSI